MDLENPSEEFLLFVLDRFPKQEVRIFPQHEKNGDADAHPPMLTPREARKLVAREFERAAREAWGWTVDTTTRKFRLACPDVMLEDTVMPAWQSRRP